MSASDGQAISNKLVVLATMTIASVVAVLFVQAAKERGSAGPQPSIAFTAPGADKGLPGVASVDAVLARYQRPPAIPFPPDNSYTAAKAQLGQALFFDPRLSGSKWISCASCHNPALSWGDGLPRAIGHGMQQLGRRTPTILNLAWGHLLFWDGRASSLEEQALGLIASPAEMNMPLDELLSRITSIAEYRPLFEQAFPNESITKQTVAKAIATYERTIVSGKAPFDRWVEGQSDAISEDAKRGFALFNGKANCAKCHGGWRFTDDGFHDLGLPGDDPGRGKILPGVEASQFAFKTPTLRNVDRRAPYMHDGSLATLEQVIDYYDAGGKVQRPSLSQDMKPLRLTSGEKKDLVAFLLTLTSADKPAEIPSLPQ